MMAEFHEKKMPINSESPNLLIKLDAHMYEPKKNVFDPNQSQLYSVVAENQLKLPLIKNKSESVLLSARTLDFNNNRMSLDMSPTKSARSFDHSSRKKLL